MNRIGVWFSDGSILTVDPRRSAKDQNIEARKIMDDANKGNAGGKRAVLVEFELDDAQMHEIV